VGVLRKLAELVVEFPDDPPGAGGSGKGKAAPDDDVLAQIERARAELDSVVSSKPGAGGDRLADGKFKPEAKSQPPTAAAVKLGGAGSSGLPAGPGVGGAAAGSGIALPSLLTTAQVYERAGLAPKEGDLNIFRIEQMLADPEMADLELSIRARTVKMTLKTMGKELHEILLDAAKRDQALDSYGQWLGEAVTQVEAQVQAANARLKEEIDEFIAKKNAEIDGNTALLAQAHSARQSFVQEKAREEERLFNIAAPFVAPGENPVVVGGSSAPKGEQK
jgi:hypothetical protein